VKLPFEPGRGEVKVLRKISWIHSFCVAQQREMGVLFKAFRKKITQGWKLIWIIVTSLIEKEHSI
jgi:hypothetical protein